MHFKQRTNLNDTNFLFMWFACLPVRTGGRRQAVKINGYAFLRGFSAYWSTSIKRYGSGIPATKVPPDVRVTVVVLPEEITTLSRLVVCT